MKQKPGKISQTNLLDSGFQPLLPTNRGLTLITLIQHCAGGVGTGPLDQELGV